MIVLMKKVFIDSNNSINDNGNDIDDDSVNFSNNNGNNDRYDVIRLIQIKMIMIVRIRVLIMWRISIRMRSGMIRKKSNDDDSSNDCDNSINIMTNS